MPRDLPRGAPSDDDGSADPRLVAALRSGERAAVAAALVDARLIVGVVALPGSEHASEGEMAVALLQARSGAQALPAFTSLATLASWRDDARPVPRPAPELAAVALGEGYDALVVDVTGPVPWTVQGDELSALAAGYVPAGEGLAARRSDPRLLPPEWEPAPELLDACVGLEVYALDLELPDRGVRAPALGLVPPAGVPPLPVAERLLTAAGRPLDLMLLDGARLEEARRCGRRL
jgi:hypothetical protein